MNNNFETQIKKFRNDKKNKTFSYRNNNIKINNASEQIKLIKVLDNTFFLEIGDDKTKYFFLLNKKPIWNNKYEELSQSIYMVNFDKLNNYEKKQLKNYQPNRFLMNTGINNKSCVTLLIKDGKAKILFIKKGEDCNLNFLPGQSTLKNLVYISLKLLDIIGYEGNVHLEDDAQINGKSLAIIKICNEILKNIRPNKYSKYSDLGFIPSERDIENLQRIVSKITKNQCRNDDKKKLLSEEIKKFLRNLVNPDYRNTIRMMEGNNLRRGFQQLIIKN